VIVESVTLRLHTIFAVALFNLVDACKDVRMGMPEKMEHAILFILFGLACTLDAAIRRTSNINIMVDVVSEFANVGIAFKIFSLMSASVRGGTRLIVTRIKMETTNPAMYAGQPYINNEPISVRTVLNSRSSLLPSLRLSWLVENIRL